MKWATNKRLHFELGVIKAIQSLGEVRIADIIKVLTRGADFIPSTASLSPVQVETIPAKEVKTAEHVATPPQVKANPKNAFSSLDSLIEAAPESIEPLEKVDTAPPWNNDLAPAEVKPPATESSTVAHEDAFQNDPLIQAALIKFEGKFVSPS